MIRVTLLKGWIFCIAFLLFSCTTESENSNGENLQEISNKNQSDIKKADCLAGYNHDYSRLLTKEDVLKHISILNPAELKIKYNQNSVQRKPEYGEIYYNWPIDRPDVQINPSFPLKTPDMNTVSFSNLSFKEGNVADIRERFHTAYKEMSPEELDLGMASLEESFKDKSIKELETAKKLLIARSNSKNKPVSGVGDYAYWFPTKTMDLYLGSKIVVLAGNAQFEVTAKMSENDEENLEVAKKIALEILAKCAD
jgi:hypothetical protein